MGKRETFRYGSSPDQEGDLHLPASRRAAVVCLLHGGFWRQPYGRDQMTPIADDLQRRGYAVCNLEYRRIGTPGFEWQHPLEDVLAGIDYLAHWQGAVDLEQLVLCGHSAGGHLALWAASRRGPTSASPVKVRAVVGQAPIADLIAGHSLGLGGGAASEFLGATPATDAGRFAAASPQSQLPLGIPQLIIHGTRDDAVPLALSESYVIAARRHGDSVELHDVPDYGHMEFLDPASEPHRILCDWLARVIAV